MINEARPLPGDSVLVYGCGGVGLNSLQGARLLHAGPIIAVDNNEESLDLARKFGATHVINAANVDVAEEVRKITNNQGAKYVIVAMTNPRGMETAIDSAACPSDVYFLGVPADNTRITIDPLAIHRSRTLRGSCGGAIIPERDIAKYLGLYNAGTIKLDELISHRFSLWDINEAIEVTRSGKAGRCIIDMNYQLK
jgi:S-(hydroxymethyl)glutathione dehydrogenase/alcohol dehydrogenase